MKDEFSIIHALEFSIPLCEVKKSAIPRATHLGPSSS